MCLSQCINHFCPDPKTLAPPASWPGTRPASSSVPLPAFSHPLASHVSALSVLAFLSLLSNRNASVASRIVEEPRVSGRGDESNRHQVCTFPNPYLFPLNLFPADSPHPPRGTTAPGLRAFLMLNVAFCLCGYMGDSGERWSPGQRFFQMLNARFVPTHPVCPCYVASTGLPGTSQRTRQLRGLVIGVTRHRGW